MDGQQTPASSHHRGIVKQILSGDTIIIRGRPQGGPPPEKQIGLSNITVPKLERRATEKNEGKEKDDPYAWEAREFLRTKLIGKEVYFLSEKKGAGEKEFGTLYLGRDATGENIAESLLREGLAELRNENNSALKEIRDAAKTAGIGIHSTEASRHVRNVKWTVDSVSNFIDSYHQKPVKAIVEHVLSAHRLRVVILPDYYYASFMISGIRCPTMRTGSTEQEPFAEEAKFFFESRLLNRDVELIMETVNNDDTIVGSILHPNGNIAELLLKEGFARCVDWCLSSVSTGPEKLRAAEKVAKEKKLRLWKDYTPPVTSSDPREFQGKVMEIVNCDALIVKVGEESKKIFLSSIRPPRPDPGAGDMKGRKLLYEVPYLFEGREFLRKKLIGKRVNVVVDYIQPAANNFPEKTCCTVTIGGVNVAEALLSKGFATLVMYRSDNDQRSLFYNELSAAETKAKKSQKGLHSTKENPPHRIIDLSGESHKAKQFLPSLQRQKGLKAIIEFVASGARFRAHVVKENCLITFLLSGISCPRAGYVLPNGTKVEGEPWGEEAYKFSKELVLQHDVEIEVETIDRAGNFIGWLTVDNQNLSVLLVQAGLSSMHFSAERSPYFKTIEMAEKDAKNKKLNIWSTYEEPKEIIKEEPMEREERYEKVVVTDVSHETTPEVRFYAQNFDDGPSLETFMTEFREEMNSNPPIIGCFRPKKGDLCAAKFPEDGLWYRARVEKVTGNDVLLFYVDFGNHLLQQLADIAALPVDFQKRSFAAKPYYLAFVKPSDDPEFQKEALQCFDDDVRDKVLKLNVEYRASGNNHVTLWDEEVKVDLGKSLVEDGCFMVDTLKERRFQKVLSEYKIAQDVAKKNRRLMWCYGDVTPDDDVDRL